MKINLDELARAEQGARVRLRPARSREDGSRDDAQALLAVLAEEQAALLRTPEGREEELEQAALGIAARLFSDAERRRRAVRRAMEMALGLGPLEEAFQDPGVTEIMVNSPDDVVVERRGKIESAGTSFGSEAELLGFVKALAERAGAELSAACPRAFFHLRDGSRVQAFLPPIVLHPTLIIRKAHALRMVGREELVSSGTITAEAMEWLERAVRARLSTLILGRPNSGKTTLLASLLRSLPAEERIAVIELVRELPVWERKNTVSFAALDRAQSPITLSDLVAWRLHGRFDRVVVGEVLDAEGPELLHAGISGDRGILGTIHCTGVEALPERFFFMFLRRGEGWPLSMVRELVLRAVDVAVAMDRLPDGRRVVLEIAALDPDEGVIRIFEREGEALVRRGSLPERIRGWISRQGLELD